IYTRSQLKENSAPDIGMHYLNKVQQRAVNKVLRARDVAVVHGPPGTGKTTTLVEAIHETLRRESQVMVCAQSNMAVDWICEKLTERGIAVIRLGNPSRVNDAMLASTYERRFEAHPDYPTLWSIRRDIRRIQSSREHGERRHQKIDRLRSRAVELELRIKADIFASARVIASTLVGSASPVLEGMRFNTLFVDEAAQALEAATLIALRRADRLVLAGDHCQLPPMVRSVEAAAGGLSRSMMEVVVENHPEAVTLLTMQYRMNADIMRFSSEWFYGGAMTAAREVAFRGILDYDVAIEWIDTATLPSPSDDDDNGVTDTEAFAEQIAGESHGRINRDEAELTLRLLEEYFLRIGTTRIREEQLDVGIISPYRAQTRLLRRMLSRSRFFKPFRSRISVNTVDGFQGQERDIIMISLVRSNSGGNIGFLRDLRRMNVAMTRARMKLIIVGNAPTLGATPFYRRLQSYIASLHSSD
ncbi:MAG: AAA family ATPase, partial [Paramuribaculum sp.]|nr:AAA family ATPase [Paramuribaculum sp.]